MPCILLPHPLLGAHVEGQWESLFVLELNESPAMKFTVSAPFHMSWGFFQANFCFVGARVHLVRHWEHINEHQEHFFWNPRRYP